MASNGAAPASGGPALHTALMEAEVACAVAHLKAAKAHGAAAGQSLDHTALDFLDANEGTAVAAGGKKKSKKKAARDPTRPKKALTGYQLFMEATRPTLDVKGKGAMSQLAKMWREMDEAAQKPWNDKARPGQEKAKADDERWKKMSPDERLIHFPPSPSLGPSPPPPPPPADAKPSKKRAKSEDGSEKKKKKKKKKRASSTDPDADTQL